MTQRPEVRNAVGKVVLIDLLGAGLSKTLICKKIVPAKCNEVKNNKMRFA